MKIDADVTNNDFKLIDFENLTFPELFFNLNGEVIFVFLLPATIFNLSGKNSFRREKTIGETFP